MNPQLPAAPAPGQRLLTPRLAGQGNTRLNLHLSEAEYESIINQLRRLPWEATVTDLRSGNRFHIRGADCGSPGCNCDAIATPIKEKQ